MKGGEKMKRQAIFTVVATLILYGVASAAIINTAHDLSTGSTYYGAGLSGSSEQICVFCHTPHFPAGISAAEYTTPLWNHKLSSQTYSNTYVSPTMNNTTSSFAGTDVNTPARYSAICLSCHDGTVAVDALYNIPQDKEATAGQGPGRVGLSHTKFNANGTLKSTEPGYIGTDLRYHHPINMNYDETLDAGLNAPDNNCCVQLTGSTCDVPIYSTNCATTRGTVQCASCHDPHDNTYAPFARVSLADSSLCTVCHNK